MSCNEGKLIFFYNLIFFFTNLISFKSDIPVDKIIGRLYFFNSKSNGKFFISPDGTFIKSSFIFLKISEDLISKTERRNPIFFFFGKFIQFYNFLF